MVEGDVKEEEEGKCTRMSGARRTGTFESRPRRASL